MAVRRNGGARHAIGRSGARAAAERRGPLSEQQQPRSDGGAPPVVGLPPTSHAQRARARSQLSKPRSTSRREVKNRGTSPADVKPALRGASGGGEDDARGVE
jgi:hypothetical protein